MATNSGRGNPIASGSGPAPDQTAPPPVASETKATIQQTPSSSETATHAAGQDAGAAPASAKVKTAKELEKERKKAEKEAKFREKQAKAAQASTAEAAKPAKEKKAKQKEEEKLPEYVNDTPAGTKKRIRSFEDPYYKAYNPIAVEDSWYSWWEAQGYFKPEFTADGKVKDAGSFVIVHPPPNVTGKLHMGHALGDSLQDLMIRFNRMHGKTTLYVPGCDHAGIATQSVVENMLWRKNKQTRHDLGREKFIETVYEWKEEYHEKINAALRKLGGSFDWTREAFTMDDARIESVKEAFVRLFDDGTIYRANRLVNWCSKLNTALSNLEVINKELAGRTLMDVPGYDKKVEFGVIHYFKYPIEGSSEFIEVATTRIETMLGDTGIAVHPTDARYKHLVGKNATHPFIEGRKLRIVADDHVDPEFGSGAVKITPAHDPNDFAIGKRHDLEFINILTDDGLINENGGSFSGQKRFDARYSVAEELKKQGLYVDKKDNAMTLPICERSKDIIEPLLKPQWYVNMKEMAADAVTALNEGRFKIRPEASRKDFLRWMTEPLDWCISRQLWWGHRCPVYFAEVEGEPSDRSRNDRWFAARSEEEAREKAAKALGDKKFTLSQDEDVLDTWFSSGLWPFSTLGWPEKTDDLAKLFPTSVLETGWDIIFFWVARMVTMSLKLMGEVPFTEVFNHGLIRDSEGRKMSKSLGNVIDPLGVISGITLEELHAQLLTGNLAPSEVEKATKYQKTAFPQGIPEIGADALRFCLVAYTSTAGDINFDVKVLHAYRKFCNKIWQASKYVLGNLPEGFVPRKTRGASGKESLAEKWILHKMNLAAKELNTGITNREFMRSANVIYNFIYAELCDVFIENSKAILQSDSKEVQESAQQTLYSALECSLLLMHPFMPFLTEELWQRLPRRPDDKTESVMVAAYPVFDEALNNPAAEAAYDLVLGSSKGIRSLTTEYALKDEAKVYVQAFNEEAHKTATSEVQAIRSLSGKGVTSIEVLGPDAPRPHGSVAFPVSSDAAVFLHVKGRVDIDAELAKATAKLQKAQGALAKQRKILGDAGYQEKVAEATQAADRKKLADQESEAKTLEATIKQFEALKLEE